jgi:copper chaperone
MLTLNVEGMTCNHCISKVTKAIKELNSSATVEIDLKAHTVKVGADLSKAHSCDVDQKLAAELGSTADPLDVEDIIMALEWAGYPAVEVMTCCTPDASCH